MIIVGAKGFAKEVLEVLWQNNQTSKVSFFDDITDLDPGYLLMKHRVLRSFEEVKGFFQSQKDYRFTLGLGNPLIRYRLYKKFIEIGGEFTSTISPFARIGNYGNAISEGCNIMTGTIITSCITIEKGVLINLNCTVGHDSVIGEFVEMSPGTAVSGECYIGRFTSLGTNSTILPRIRIGENVTVGAGAVVTRDVPDNSIVVGIPAKCIKINEPIEF